jgi:guanosine-3',5'-bis(diphosphate) 3'-pyrophosphohydrolase
LETLPTFEARSWPALRERLSVRLPEQDLTWLDEAVEFAMYWHADQTRPAGEPYIEHLLEVLSVLADALEVTDVDVLRTAVLHDVVEDTGCTLEKVRDRFGDRVAYLVDWVTIPAAPVGQGQDAARAGYFTRLREAPAEARMVKLADRLSNVQRLDTHPRPEKRRLYYQETLRSVVPLAEFHPWFRQWYADWSAAYAHLSES